MTTATDVPARSDAVAPVRSARADVAGLGRLRATGFVAPAMVVIGAFLIFPALWTIYLGLLRYSLAGVNSRPTFVGANNYTSALSDPSFGSSMLKTLEYVGFSAVIGQNVLGFAIAWFMRTAARWIRTVISVLVLVSWILPGSVVAFLWQALLSREGGTLNAILHTHDAAPLLDHPMIVIIVFNIWRGTAFSMLLYASALTVVPKSHLEVSRLAGARTLEQIRDVVLPHIKGLVLTNTLLITLWTFNDFSPYLLTSGGPNHESETLPIYIYNTALIGGQLGYGSAISLLLLIANLIIAFFYIRVLRRRSAA